MIPYGRQSISEADIAAVVEVLKSDFLTQGPVVPQFETAISEYCGAEHGIAVNSATSALHLSCLALGLGPGDWLWTSPITFVASANCGLHCGAKVDFVDIDPASYNMCPDELARKLERAKHEGRLPKIVIPVHMAGQSCHMSEIHALSRKYGFKIIEDASHTIGGSYQGEHVGNCKYSDITVFSFHPVKIITTGEGGVAVTNDRGLADALVMLRSHGVTRDHSKMSCPSHGPWYYEQLALGFNLRMTDIQAALGLSQLKRLGEFVTKRQELADRYDALLNNFPVDCPIRMDYAISTFHLYIIRLNLKQISNTHRAVFESLRKNGVGVNLHYIPLHRQPFYQQFGFDDGDFPKAEKYYSEAISLPIYPALQSQDLEAIAASLAQSIEGPSN